MKNLFGIVGVILLIILVHSCEEEKPMPKPPDLTTSEITAITQTTAISGGNITDDNGEPITARGVCWDIGTDPTTENNKTSNGTGIGSFVSNITGLLPGTVYYVRSYATNNAGTSYGNEISFPTEHLKAQWNKSYFGQKYWAWNVSVVNDDIVWVMDSDTDSISITTNGGVSWTSKQLPIPEGYLRAAGGICALSASKAYFILSTSPAKGIYITNDGGNNWTKQPTGFNENSAFPDIIHFWNDNAGVAVGDASPNFEIYTTADGGVQWNRVQNENMPNGNSEFTWNTQQSFKIIGNSIYFLTSTARIFKSIDRGVTWSVINTPFYNTIYADSAITFDFKDNNNGLVSYYKRNGLANKMYKTTNGGQTWSSLTTTNFYHDIEYVPTANCYFSMNSYGGLSYSSDNGSTWTPVSYFINIRLSTANNSSTGKIFFGSIGNIYYSDYFTQIEK